MESNTEQGNLGAAPKKPKKIDVAIETLQDKMKNVDLQIQLLNKEKDVLWRELQVLEKIKSDKYSE
jgi:hypothetical protein